MKAEGEYDDPLNGTGADYVYISIDKVFFPKGEEVTRRGQIEDAVEKALAKFDGGRCVGGAFGTERSYSDFLLFDGDRSLNAVKQVLREQNVPAGTMIEFFAREKGRTLPHLNRIVETRRDALKPQPKRINALVERQQSWRG